MVRITDFCWLWISFETFENTQVKVNTKDLAFFVRLKPTCQSHNPVYHPAHIRMQALSSNGWGQKNRESLWSSWFPQGWTQEAYIRENTFLESPAQDFSLNNERIYWVTVSNLPWFRETCSKASLANDCSHYFRIVTVEDGMGKPAKEELQDKIYVIWFL